MPSSFYARAMDTSFLPEEFRVVEIFCQGVTNLLRHLTPMCSSLFRTAIRNDKEMASILTCSHSPLQASSPSFQFILIHCKPLQYSKFDVKKLLFAPLI